jgi:hypothetical protein
MTVTTPLDSLGTAGICIAVVAFIVIMTIWGMRTEARKQELPMRMAKWTPLREYQGHQHYIGDLLPAKAMNAQHERQVNELRRHCRIGKIILKERA